MDATGGLKAGAALPRPEQSTLSESAFGAPAGCFPDRRPGFSVFCSIGSAEPGAPVRICTGLPRSPSCGIVGAFESEGGHH